MSTPPPAQPIRPAATVVLGRDTPAGLSLLMVRRHPSLVFYGGAWVFPGGRVDEGDRVDGGGVLAAARRAAVREAEEEVGLSPDPARLLCFSRWVTPPGRTRRFDTHYFIGPAPAGDVRVDGTETDAHRWLTPAEALAARERGELELPPPTYVTLEVLSGQASLASAMAELRRAGVCEYVPRDFERDGGGLCYLYPGDAGYDTGDPAAGGRRHRLYIGEGDWRYESPSDDD